MNIPGQTIVNRQRLLKATLKQQSAEVLSKSEINYDELEEPSEEIMKSLLNNELEQLEKGKSYHVGTVKEWGGKSYIKTPRGWRLKPSVGNTPEKKTTSEEANTKRTIEKKQVLTLRKEINSFKEKRNKLPKDSTKRKAMQDKIDSLENKLVKDKEGTTIGVKKEYSVNGKTIRSIGVLNRADGNYDLTPVFEGSMMPTKVTITKDEYNKVKGNKTAMMQLAVTKLSNK